MGQDFNASNVKFVKKDKVALIIPYFGKWPRWFDYFLQSCEFSKLVKWIFLTDCPLPTKKYKNIVFQHFNINDFNYLSSKKLGIPIACNSPYKICDFKPAFGIIFQDYFKEFRFWGYCDIDLIFGDIDFFIRDLLDDYDVITTKESSLSGHFSIFRNLPHINNLFWKSPFSRSIFQSSKFFSFSENLKFPGRQIVNMHGSYTLQKPPGGMYNHFISNLIIWLNKNLVAIDISQLISRLSERKNINLFQNTIVATDMLLKKEGRQDWEFLWTNGHLFDSRQGKEIMYYHFYLKKQDSSFVFPPFPRVSPSEYRIGQQGLRLTNVAKRHQ